MVDFACNIFDSALVDATKMASNAERFIKIDFKYTVSMTNIVYETSVGHSIIYDMKSHRYRNLDKDTECEALAAVLRNDWRLYTKKICLKASTIDVWE